ncbi:E3 ubiquitin-protein ligase RNF19B, partial [Clarias magur]
SAPGLGEEVSDCPPKVPTTFSSLVLVLSPGMWIPLHPFLLYEGHRFPAWFNFDCPGPYPDFI